MHVFSLTRRLPMGQVECLERSDYGLRDLRSACSKAAVASHRMTDSYLANLSPKWAPGLDQEQTLANVCLAASYLGSDRSTETSEVQVAFPLTSQLPMSTWA